MTCASCTFMNEKDWNPVYREIPFMAALQEVVNALLCLQIILLYKFLEGGWFDLSVRFGFVLLQCSFDGLVLCVGLCFFQVVGLVDWFGILCLFACVDLIGCFFCVVFFLMANAHAVWFLSTRAGHFTFYGFLMDICLDFECWPVLLLLIAVLYSCALVFICWSPLKGNACPWYIKSHKMQIKRGRTKVLQ